MPKNDLTNKEFEYFKVLGKDLEKSNGKHLYWKCLCQCGNVFSDERTYIEKGIRKSCGCKKNYSISETTLIDITNEYFGNLLVLGRDREAELEHPKSKQTFWKCQCGCGNIISIEKGKLTSRGQSSCGCKRSIGEFNINTILRENNIKYLTQYTNKQLESSKKGYYRFDFAILDQDNNVIRLIEFDGPQHLTLNNFYNDIDIELRDAIKNTYAKEHGIPLVRIPYSQRDCIKLENLLGDKYLI